MSAGMVIDIHPALVGRWAPGLAPSSIFLIKYSLGPVSDLSSPARHHDFSYLLPLIFSTNQLKWIQVGRLWYLRLSSSHKSAANWMPSRASRRRQTDSSCESCLYSSNDTSSVIVTDSHKTAVYRMGGPPRSQTNSCMLPITIFRLRLSQNCSLFNGIASYTEEANGFILWVFFIVMMLRPSSSHNLQLIGCVVSPHWVTVIWIHVCYP